MDFWQSLILLMQMMLVWEDPYLKSNPDTLKAWNQDIAEMVEIDRKVASHGVLYNPEVDAVIIGSIRWYEARLKKNPRDGDCYIKMTYPSKKRQRELRAKDPNNYLPKWAIKQQRVCRAKGPMQISYNNRKTVPAWPEIRELFVGIKPWQKQFNEGINQWKLTPVLTEDEFRDPEINVRLGYGILWHWMNETAKDLPSHETRQPPLGAWLTAWGWGKVSNPNRISVRYVDREGTRRCALTTAILEKLNKKPANWFCGHEHKKVKDKHQLKLLKAIKGFKLSDQ